MPGPARKIVFGYARVSTTVQREEGVSLDAQRERIMAHAAGKGWHIDPANILIDAGISGSSTKNRPALKRVLDAVCASGGILIIYSLSRLARSTRDAMNIAERMEAAGAELVSITETIDTTTAVGRMIYRLLSVLNEFEKELGVERTRATAAYKKSQGQALGPPPFGKRTGLDGKTLVAHPAEAGVVARMKAWRAAGWSNRRIAMELDRQKVPTKKGNVAAGDRPAWSHIAVGRILKDTPRPGSKLEEVAS